METRQDKLSILSDLHKSVYGFRPREKYSELSDMQLDVEFEHLQSRLEVQMAEEANREAEDVEKFKITVKKVMTYCNTDRKTSLRYLAEAENNELGSAMDVEGFLWGHGILFTQYGAELKPVLIEIAKEKHGVQ